MPDSRVQAPSNKATCASKCAHSPHVLGKSEVSQPSPGSTRGYQPMEKTILCDAGAEEELRPCCNVADQQWLDSSFEGVARDGHGWKLGQLESSLKASNWSPIEV